MRGLIFIVFISISINLFAQSNLGLVTYSQDSTLVVKHFWNVSDNTADSVVITGKNIDFQLPVMENAARKYANSNNNFSSLPFDFKRLTINKIWYFDENTIALIATNESIRIDSLYYIHLIFIDKKTFETVFWITARSPRGRYDLEFLTDTLNKKIILPKNKNKILDDQIFLLNTKNETFQEIKISKNNSVMSDTKSHKSKFSESDVFMINY